MYSTTDFRKGLKIEIDGTPFEIIEFQHFKPGKGGAMVRTKLRNILNGRVSNPATCSSCITRANSSCSWT